MTTIYSNFEDYQKQFERSAISAQVEVGFLRLKGGVQKVVAFVDESIQVPELVRKIVMLAVTLFSVHPFLQKSLELPRQLCVEFRVFTNFFKGFKSVGRLFDITLTWRAMALSASGITVLCIDSITLFERWNLYKFTAIKTALKSVPIFGALPFGGLLALSTGGMMSMLILVARDKNGRLNNEKRALKTGKLKFWLKPIDLKKITSLKNKYSEKIKVLKGELDAYENLLQEGKKVEIDLQKLPISGNQLATCQKAIQELNQTIEDETNRLKKYEIKFSQFSKIKREFSSINPKELEAFRQAKHQKWAAKLDRLNLERKANLIFLANGVSIATKQFLILGRTAAGYGALSQTVMTGFELLEIGCGITSYFMKRSINQFKIPSAELEKFVNI